MFVPTVYYVVYIGEAAQAGRCAHGHARTVVHGTCSTPGGHECGVYSGIRRGIRRGVHGYTGTDTVYMPHRTPVYCGNKRYYAVIHRLRRYTRLRIDAALTSPH